MYLTRKLKFKIYIFFILERRTNNVSGDKQCTNATTTKSMKNKTKEDVHKEDQGNINFLLQNKKNITIKLNNKLVYNIALLFKKKTHQLM